MARRNFERRPYPPGHKARVVCSCGWSSKQTATHCRQCKRELPKPEPRVPFVARTDEERNAVIDAALRANREAAGQ